jgi:3-oxoacyl-[acyl-carrier protein] reductase
MSIDKYPCVAILGATGGVGSALARMLSSRGCKIALIGRNADKLLALDKELGALSYPISSADPAEIGEALQHVKSAMSCLDGVVNCIGSLLLKPAHLTTDSELDSVLSVNLGSAFAAVRSSAQLIENGGSVVLVSSAAARIGLANHEAIAAAKAGIEGLTRSAAATYASRNIRVNAVAPGMIRTELTRRFWENGASAAMSAAMHPLGRIGEPEDVASLIAWLLEPANSWITGQVIGIDGGLADVRSKSR